MSPTTHVLLFQFSGHSASFVFTSDQFVNFYKKKASCDSDRDCAESDQFGEILI